jgi:hypothetical protein
MSDDGTFVELDARNRASLGKLAGPHRRFLARVEPGGVIVMTPATVVPIGAPAGAAERARVAAEELPTVGHWTDPTDNIGTGTGATAGPPSAWLDGSDGDDGHTYDVDEWYAPFDDERDDR